MFTRFFCALLSFYGRNFPLKSETKEPETFIMDLTMSASTSYAIMYLSTANDVSLETIFIGYHRRKKLSDAKLFMIQNG